MKKNLLFSLLAIFLAGAGFGGISMAEDNNKWTFDESVITTNGGTITDENTVEFRGLTINFSSEDASIGRGFDGYRAPAARIRTPNKFNSLESMTDVMYSKEKNFTNRLSWSNLADSESRNYLDVYVPIKAEYLANKKLKNRVEEGKYTFSAVYSFDNDKTDGDNHSDKQSFTIKLLANNITLKKDGKTIFKSEDGVVLVDDGQEMVAKIGNKSYATLEEAISAANNEDTITLLEDVNEDVDIPVGKTIILNLGGNKLTNESNHTIINNGNLTIEGEGTVDNITHQRAAIFNRGTATINGGNYIRSKENGVSKADAGGNSYYTIKNIGTMTINGGTIGNKGSFSSMVANGYFNSNEKDNWNGIANPELTITNGTFDGGLNSIKNDDYGILDIQGGTFINTVQATLLNRGKATISDGTFSPKEGTDAVMLGYKNGDIDVAELTITNGTFEGPFSYFKSSQKLNGGKLDIQGGIYSVLPAIEEYTVPTHKYLAKQEDGTYQLADQTAISEIKVNITAPVKNGAPIIPTTDTEGITFTADGIKWYKTVDNIDTELTTDEKYAENTAYKVVIPYTVADSHYLADSYTVTPTAGTENHATAGQITITFEADAVAEGYTIKFVNHDGTELKTYTVAVNETPAYDGAIPTKASDSSYNYSFKGWTPEIVAATDNATYTAEFTATSKPSYSGGGGSSRSSSTTTTKTNDTKKAEETTKDETKVDEQKADEPKTDENKVDGNNDSVAPATFSQEFQDAYEFAYKNGITTMDSIEKADMYGPLTRVAMAKMLSQYAINVLGKEPDTTKVVPTFSDVDAKLDADYNNGITLAYQLGIMGIGINKYRPFDLVTRAEFGTALSRMLFGLEDGEGNEWYSTHLAKLMEEKIITNNNPNLQELRGYVMIMLMRSAQ